MSNDNSDGSRSGREGDSRDGDGSGRNPARPSKPLDTASFRKALFGQYGINPDALSQHDGMPVGRSSGAPLGEARTGYGNPPHATRFAKGQSGNPKGRPKGKGEGNRNGKGKGEANRHPASLDAIRNRYATALVKIRDGDGVNEITTYEALLRHLNKLAFGGGVQATRLALAMTEQAMRDIETAHQDNLAWVAAYRADYADKAAAYERAGEPVPDWIARPEDIHYSIEKGLRITGPYDVEGLANILLLKQWRDAMHIRMVYDEATFFAHPGARSTFTIAELIVFAFDHLMPRRWKLASPEMREREAALIWTTRRLLIKQMEDAFAPLGFTLRLDKPMPPVPDKILRAYKINPKQVREKFARRGGNQQVRQT
jgi:hypothetical protein